MTPMGSRLMHKWTVLPLKAIPDIQRRQACVGYLVSADSARESLQKLLKNLGDLERLTSKIPLGKANPRELYLIAKTLGVITELTLSLNGDDIPLPFQKVIERLDPCPSLEELLLGALSDDPPVSLAKGQVIRDGWHSELDEWRKLIQNGKELIADVQAREAQRTGITSLKVGFNNVFGYYLEVTNKYKDKNLVPEDWVRKQTLKGSERYITSELKELEAKILNAQSEIQTLESRLYEELMEKVLTHISTLITNAKTLAEIDCYQSMAELAVKNRYVQPLITEGYDIDLLAGRHPVIETTLPADDIYVPNDVHLNQEDQQIMMITGPNMSGKSAVLRQTALICLMAHMGSHVPAEKAEIGVIDKIFTRVGASDNISSGESTFMVEMNETASILNNLSTRSLVLLDEIGRGTSTYDGISIAWSIAEFIHDHGAMRPKTLFATHYHELNQLEASFERVVNYHVATKDLGDQIIFLRKLIKGASEASFGIHVAQLAGMPRQVVDRAQKLLTELEQRSVESKSKVQDTLLNQERSMHTHQLNIFDLDNLAWRELETEISALDLQALTPIEALLKLKEIQDKLAPKEKS